MDACALGYNALLFGGIAYGEGGGTDAEAVIFTCNGETVRVDIPAGANNRYNWAYELTNVLGAVDFQESSLFFSTDSTGYNTITSQGSAGGATDTVTMTLVPVSDPSYSHYGYTYSIFQGMGSDSNPNVIATSEDGLSVTFALCCYTPR